MKAIGYKRLSDEDQSNYSLSAQERAIHEYCERNNLELVNIFEDNGQSSYTFDRKAFTLLEKELRGVQYLVVYHLDRFSRNMAEAMLKIKEYLARGIKVRDITEPIDLDDHDPNTFLLRSMKFMVAESELHRIRQRTKAGVVQAAMSGRHVNMAPFGYINSRDEKNKPILVIDEEKAVVVRMIFREYLNGMSLYDAHRLARRHGFKLTGKSAINRLLSNPLYAGLVRVPAHKNSPEKLVRGIHSAIISEQDYWLVQERLTGRTITTQNRDEVPLRGVLKTESGRLFTAMNAKSKSGRYYWYYQEQDTKKIYPANRLHNEFYSILDELSFSPESLEQLYDRLSLRLTNYLAGRSEKIRAVQQQLKAIDKRIEAAEVKWLTKPDISESTFNKVMVELKADRARMQDELAALNTNQQVYWDKMQQVVSTLLDIRAAFIDLPTHKKHQFINMVFCNSLAYYNDSYKTPGLHEYFRDKELTLKEKGLLEFTAPIRNLNDIPIRTRDGS